MTDRVPFEYFITAAISASRIYILTRSNHACSVSTRCSDIIVPCNTKHINNSNIMFFSPRDYVS